MPKSETCAVCSATATKKVIWADGRAYQPSCDEHVKRVQQMLTKKNGAMTELAGVQDLAEAAVRMIDLVSSRVYPGLERKPGGPDNWVEAAKGLPSYIERIAKHLHYERGYSISHAIATAVNTVKRWARGGTVTKHGTTKRVSPATIAKAAAAVASWYAKRKAGALALSDDLLHVIDLTDVSEEFAFDLLEQFEPQDATHIDPAGPRSGTGVGGPDGDTSVDLTLHAILSSMDIEALAERANRIEDPEARDRARQAVLDLAVPRSELTAEKRRQRAKTGAAMPDGSFPIFDKTSLRSAIRLARTPAQRAHVIRRARSLGLMSMIPEKWTMNLTEEFVRVMTQGTIDLASTIAPRNARGLAKDGRRSYRKQGRWRHGFIPVDRAAQEAKAKGSPIAMRRLTRLFGKPKSDGAGSGRVGTRTAGGKKRNPKDVNVSERAAAGSERARDIAHLRKTRFEDSSDAPRAELPKAQKEASKASRIPERARQNWDEIPDSLKTVRNGKRYVLAEFGGKQFVTEWVGGVRETESTPLAKRKVMRTLSSADAANMSQAELRAIAANPRTPESVRKQARAALRDKAREAAK